MVTERTFSTRDGEYKMHRHNLPSGVEWRVVFDDAHTSNVSLHLRTSDPLEATEYMIRTQRTYST